MSGSSLCSRTCSTSSSEPQQSPPREKWGRGTLTDLGTAELGSGHTAGVWLICASCKVLVSQGISGLCLPRQFLLVALLAVRGRVCWEMWGEL